MIKDSVRILRVLAFVLVGLVAVTGCRHPAAKTAQTGTPPQTYSVRGTLREIREGGRVAVIQHEAIPGYMAAMTMPFDVRPTHELDGFRPGDDLSFRLNVTDTDGWIDRLTLVHRGEPADDKPKVESVRVARIVDELKVGELMPDYRFTNELRQPVSFAELRGQAVGLTFIYTRCPYPTFCPRQTRNFAEVCQRLKSMRGGPKNWRLLSLSFDPENDTPTTLRTYARQYDYDPKRWSFLTGAMIDIDAITEQFGVFFARDGSGFSHNVRTVVIDAGGRIQRILVGNEWAAEEFAAEMVKAARSGSKATGGPSGPPPTTPKQER